MRLAGTNRSLCITCWYTCGATGLIPSMSRNMARARSLRQHRDANLTKGLAGRKHNNNDTNNNYIPHVAVFRSLSCSAVHCSFCFWFSMYL